MKQIFGTQADPATIALIAVAFGKALNDNLTISPHKEEENADGLVAAAAMLDALVEPIVKSGDWEGVFSIEATELGEWMAEHFNQNKVLPDMQQCIKQAAMSAGAATSDDTQKQIKEQAANLNALAAGSGFIMPSVNDVITAFPPHNMEEWDVLRKIRLSHADDEVEITPIAIDLRFPNEIPDGESRMAWFAVDFNNGDDQFAIGRSLPFFGYSGRVLCEDKIETITKAAGKALYDLRSMRPMNAFSNLELPTREGARSDIDKLINEQGGVIFEGYGYQDKEGKPIKNEKERGL